MTKAEPTPSEQPIEMLQQRYRDLNEKKIRAEAERDGARRQLDKLKADAREKYGTDDLAELQKRLDDMIAENARKRAAYQADLDKIERDLADVERKFASPLTTPSAAVSSPPLNAAQR